MQLELKQTTQTGVHHFWWSTTLWTKLLIILRKNPKLHPRDTKLALDIPPTPRPHRGAVLGLSFAPDVVSGWLLAIERGPYQAKTGLLLDFLGCCTTNLPFARTT